jgi:hydroxyacylglutathione hydrolase
MLLKRLYDDGLAQAGYLIGCDVTGEAVVVDPLRDVTPYLDAAKVEGLKITHVTETHIHADFVSGSRELAQLAGATLHLSDEGAPDWRYGYAADANAGSLKHGDQFSVGKVRLDVLHTPGHTPEHLAFLVTDTASSDAPLGMLSGDFLFVSEVGRPDLLERVADRRGTMEGGARALFQSVQRLRDLPDYLQIWPGHGAGSACGKSLGAMPQSTLGYERLTNWALRTSSEDEFVRTVLAGQPEPPPYFAEMKRINRDGPRLLGARARPQQLDLARIDRLIAAGVLVVDTRTAQQFAGAHLPGTLNIPLNRSFTGWAGWLVPYDKEFALLIDPGRAGAVELAVRELSLIGLDRIAGYGEIDPEAIDRRRAAGIRPSSIRSLNVAQLQEQLGKGAIVLIDVRSRAEWGGGHIPGALHIPLGELAERQAEIPSTGPVVVQCRTGGRAAIGASLLQKLGRKDVLKFDGGYLAWQAAGHPVEADTRSG